MRPIASLVSDFRQMMHGTRLARFVYTLMGWPYQKRDKTSVGTVLFLGDSITQLWAIEDTALFESGGLINAGVGGQTSGQLRRTCRLAIIDHDPDAVHLLCGINDIAENEGPVTNKRILSNIESVVRYCRARDIRVAIGSLTPVTTVPWNPRAELDRIKDLNESIRLSCIKRGVLFIDYFSILADDKQRLCPEYATDGLHLSFRGYQAIKPALLHSIVRIKEAASCH